MDQQLDNPAGGALTRAYASLFPLASVLGIAFFGAGLTIGVVPADSAGGRILVAILVIASLGAVVLAPMVALFNRPRFVIPPHLRANGGLMSEFTGRRNR
jgi:hypothetical protein